jgi:hypothetical protein
MKADREEREYKAVVLAVRAGGGEGILEHDNVWVTGPSHLAKPLEKVQLMTGARVTDVGTKDLEGVERDLWWWLSGRVKRLALSLDQPDSGEAAMPKLVEDGVIIRAVGDCFANINGMVATRRVTLDIFDVFPHDEASVEIQRDARWARFWHGGNFFR